MAQKMGSGVMLNWCKSWNTISYLIITSLMSTKTLNLEKFDYTHVIITLNKLYDDNFIEAFIHDCS